MKQKTLALVACAAVTVLSSCTIRQVQNEVRTVSVSGTGTVYVDPDFAKITLAVETLNKDLLAASTENAKKMSAVQEALIAAGLAKDDITTENYNINQESRWENGRQILGNYRVSNQIIATVHKIDQAGVVIDSAVKAGANNLSSVNFGVTDTIQAVKQARIQAVKQATESANLLASTSGATLGKVVSINEDYSSYERPLKMDNVTLSLNVANSAPTTSINAEKSKISITVHIVYALQ